MTSNYTPSSEAFWRPDQVVADARKLPEWAQFHRTCGEQNVFFDHIERVGGRLSSTYRAVAFSVHRDGENWRFRQLSEGRGAGVVAALESALNDCGVNIPLAAAMIARGLRGASAPAAEDDDFETLLARPAPAEIDEFEELL